MIILAAAGLIGCGGSGGKDTSSSSSLAADLTPMLAQAVKQDATGDREVNFDADEYNALLDLSDPGQRRLVDVRAAKRSDFFAVATGTVVNTRTVRTDKAGIGRLLDPGAEVKVEQRMPVQMSFALDEQEKWQPGEFKALEPRELPSAGEEGGKAEDHVAATLKAMFTYLRADEAAYNDGRRRLYATGADEEKIAADGDFEFAEPMAAPRIGGDDTRTTLGLLDQDGLSVSDSDQYDLLDDFLPASDGTELLTDDCVLDLQELRRGPLNGVRPQTPPAPDQQSRLDGITHTIIFTGEVDVTARDYQCPGADREATNTVAFRVDATRVRAAGAPWKTTYVALGRSGESPESPVYGALGPTGPELDLDE